MSTKGSPIKGTGTCNVVLGQWIMILPRNFYTDHKDLPLATLMEIYTRTVLIYEEEDKTKEELTVAKEKSRVLKDIINLTMQTYYNKLDVALHNKLKGN
jgi:hypothetical protein